MKEANIIVDEEFKRKKSNVLKLNNAFSAENIKDLSEKIHRYGKYADNDYESDESIHYVSGHGVNYYYSDESRSKKRIKRKSKKNVVKKLQMQNIKTILVIKKIKNTKKNNKKKIDINNADSDDNSKTK